MRGVDPQTEGVLDVWPTAIHLFLLARSTSTFPRSPGGRTARCPTSRLECGGWKRRSRNCAHRSLRWRFSIVPRTGIDFSTQSSGHRTWFRVFVCEQWNRQCSWAIRCGPSIPSSTSATTYDASAYLHRRTSITHCACVVTLRRNLSTRLDRRGARCSSKVSTTVAPCSWSRLTTPSPTAWAASR